MKYELIRKPFDNKKGMIINEMGDVIYLTFPIFDNNSDRLIHGFSTRIGGVSKGIFSSMNLSSSRGDDKEAVLENYNRISKAIGFSIDSIVSSKQTHTTNVIEVTAKDRGEGITREISYDNVDGLVTNIKGVTLATFYADCVPLFFYDPVNNAIGLSHSGWRGTVNRMGRATLNKMKDLYGTNPEEVLAAIGPSICMDCYEVSEDVATQFYDEFKYSDAEMDKILLNKGNGKYQLNLHRVNYNIMLDEGVKADNIDVTDLCTCCNPDFLFSHRKSQGKRGNLAAFMALK